MYYPSGVNDLAMTCSDFVNTLKVLIVLKTPRFLELTMAIETICTRGVRVVFSVENTI